MLTRMNPKKFPKLSALQTRKRRRHQTPDEQFAIIQMMNAAFGGTVH